ncbi:MAG: enoyl-CoA hydratase/isomerase family protein [Deltaproteobacteria bacterium]|nr:enoyl-CoA hydratase/isomerase family protein [Deltaproteobacteria bacterium]
MTHPLLPPLLRDLRGGVLTLTMNRPAQLNGWTQEMMAALKGALADASRDDAVRAVVLTGVGRYYCAGVNLSATLKLAPPKALHAQIIAHNQALFDSFLDLTKPIVVALNGHAIGASVTSATLCDALLAAEGATLSTPFAALGVPPEGCSSVLFERLMGAEAAARALGAEGWKPTAAEALAAGLVTGVRPPEELLPAAQALAAEWAAAGRARVFRGGLTREALKEVNARESRVLADAFLAPPFLRAQLRFLARKRRWAPALLFGALWATRWAWGRWLPRG